MSREHRKYVRQERASKDLQQTVFAQGALKENPHKWATYTEKGLDPFRDVTCLFCLGLNPVRLFLISTKKGYHRSQGKCPLCGQGMMLKSLSKVMTSPEQYAVFAYNYAKMGFWKKVSFEIWKKRLGMMGWTDRFWTEYKRLRGDLDKEAENRELEEKWKEYEECT